MKNWSIATRATVGVLLVMAATILVAVAGHIGLASLGRATSQITDKMAALGAVGDVRAASLGVRRFEKDFIINAGDAAAQDKYASEWNEEMAKLRSSLEHLASFTNAAEERQADAGARAAVQRYGTGFEAVIAAARANRSLPPSRLNQLVSPVKDEIRHVIAFADKVAETRDREMREEAAAAVTTQRRITLLLYLALAVGIAIGVAAAFVVARSVSAIVRNLTSEAERLTAAAVKGALSVRARTESVSQEFRPVVAGMNQTMDAFAKPILTASENMERISQGDIPEQIDEMYEGDFDRIKQSLNRCIAAVAAVVADGKTLAAAALEGKLSLRADAGRHQGEFRKIVEGFNGTLDAVIKPISEATQVLERLAQRDLRARVKGSYQGDHAKITEALNAAAGALHDAMAQVAQAVGQVSSASAQIASSSQAVASGASEQASSLEETSSSLEAMSSMTKQSADNAQQASALAATAKGAGSEGSAAMEQMTGARGKIKASADGTSPIIKDINEIAFQTNLLALNAAVEAARAGEAGRGFAVVAEEVRSLALRSKEAANKTEELIRQSVKEAGEGEVTAKHVNQKLSEIVASVSKVTDIVVEIAEASKEQSSGIEQVNKAMAQMNAVTQQNAASSEESSSAATELSGQSEELAAMVGTFQLEGVVATRKQATAQRVLAGPARKSPGPRKNGSAGITPRPEEIIPLDDSVTFKEF